MAERSSGVEVAGGTRPASMARDAAYDPSEPRWASGERLRSLRVDYALG